MYDFLTWGKGYESEEAKTISGESFAEFLDICFRYATCFSMMEADWFRCVNDDLRRELQPFLLKEITTLKWYGYDYTDVDPEDKCELKIYIYRADVKAKDVILKYCSDIFLRTKEDGKWKNSTQNLEDLCFFIQDKLFVGVISHEKMLRVIPPNDEVRDLIHKLGEWECCEDACIEFPEL